MGILLIILIIIIFICFKNNKKKEAILNEKLEINKLSVTPGKPQPMRVLSLSENNNLTPMNPNENDRHLFNKNINAISDNQSIKSNVNISLSPVTDKGQGYFGEEIKIENKKDSDSDKNESESEENEDMYNDNLIINEGNHTKNIQITKQTPNINNHSNFNQITIQNETQIEGQNMIKNKTNDNNAETTMTPI